MAACQRLGSMPFCPRRGQQILVSTRQPAGRAYSETWYVCVSKGDEEGWKNLQCHHALELFSQQVFMWIINQPREKRKFLCSPFFRSRQLYIPELPQGSGTSFVSLFECVHVMSELRSCSLSANSLSLCPASLRTDAGSVVSVCRGRGLIGVVVGVNFN